MVECEEFDDLLAVLEEGKRKKEREKNKGENELLCDAMN